MDIFDEAVKLLETKVKNVDFEDEIYALVFDKVTNIIKEVENELGDIDEDDNQGECWYDDIRDDMMEILYERIGNWLKGNN